MVEVAISRVCQLERAEANVVKGLIVDAECFVSIFNQLMDREGGIVWLNDSVGDFRRRYNRK